MRSQSAELRQTKEVASRLFARNLRSQYRRSILGYAWLVLPTLATTILWVFLNDADLLVSGATSIPYGAFVLLGTFFWQTFVDALQAPIQQVRRSTGLLVKVPFPRESILAAGVAEVLFSALVRSVVVISAFVLLDYEIAWSTTPLAGAALIGTALFGSALGVLLAPLALLYEDVSRGVMLATTMWFFLTPVVFPVPTGRRGTLVSLNPTTSLVASGRDWFTVGESDHATGFVLVVSTSILAIALGIIIFRIAMPHVIDRLEP